MSEESGSSQAFDWSKDPQDPHVQQALTLQKLEYHRLVAQLLKEGDAALKAAIEAEIRRREMSSSENQAKAERFLGWAMVVLTCFLAISAIIETFQR